MVIGLTAAASSLVGAPLIAECSAKAHPTARKVMIQRLRQAADRMIGKRQRKPSETQGLVHQSTRATMPVIAALIERTALRLRSSRRPSSGDMSGGESLHYDSADRRAEGAGRAVQQSGQRRMALPVWRRRGRGVEAKAGFGIN